MKVAIIGSGASGLTAIKACLDEGLDPVCYERTVEIGGLWNYKDNVSQGQACVMKSTVINSSKEMSSFSDFLIPESFPNFMHNKYVYKYFQMYADHFGLKKYIKFQTEVVSVEKANDFAETGQWQLTVNDKESGKQESLVYDAVMICTGHHAEINRPSFPGLDRFQGRVIHSHDYRHPKGFDNQRVLIIGIGNSGGDLAVELSHVASQVYLSTRRGSWIYNRIAERGMPVDMLNITRLASKVFEKIPWLVNSIASYKLNYKFDHKTYSLQPNYPPLSGHPMVNDELPNKIVSGAVIIKSNIKEFTETGVIFDDDSVAEDIDVVFLATGYIFGFPFLDKSVIEVKNNEVELYKYMFSPDLDHSTLAVIGLVQPYGSIMPISEMQCRLATRVFKGVTQLPSKVEMRRDIDDKKEAMSNRYVHTQRHTIQVDFVSFMDELAELVGCKPNLLKMLLSDPALAMTCIFGPCTPFQYRLQGPGSWQGARKAIMTQWSRVKAPFKTRKLGYEEKASQLGFFLFFFLFVAIATITMNFFM